MDQIEIYLEYGNLKWLIIYLLATPLFVKAYSKSAFTSEAKASEAKKRKKILPLASRLS